jgi:hypothetical protein
MSSLFSDIDLTEIRAHVREMRDLFRGVFANPNGYKVLENLFNNFCIPPAEVEHPGSLRYAGRMDVLSYIMKNVNVFGVEEDKV